MNDKLRRLALNCRDDRPTWSMPADAIPKIRERLGPEWELRVVESAGNSRGDGGAVSAEALDAVRGAEVYIGAGFPLDILLAAGPGLLWAHTTAAGVSSLLYPEMVASSVILTNAAGIHAEPMAESVLGMMLYFARGFDHAAAAQRRGVWEQEPFIGESSEIREVGGAAVAILGLGGIGRALERRAKPMGMRVIGLTSRSTQDELHAALRACDYFVITVPDTRQTRGLIGRKELAMLQRSAVLINVSRGTIVDEIALADALASDRLRGAGLDVFAVEPLPPESPLWKLPNALITPHVSAVTRRFWSRQLDLIIDNIDRYRAGAPLRNRVDKQRGY